MKEKKSFKHPEAMRAYWRERSKAYRERKKQKKDYVTEALEKAKENNLT